ncbi:MAG: cytochrome c maturation protein CcmE [Anaerolineales bacterium]
MTHTTWEKNPENARAWQTYLAARGKYLVIGLVLLAAVGYMVVIGMATARYYITVAELVNDPERIGQDVRVAGAVDGDSVVFDPDTQQLQFTIINIPGDADEIRAQGGLENVLINAKDDPSAARMTVTIEQAEIPDLLYQPHVQAIVEGYLNDDGSFTGTNLMLKCPTRYEEEAPNQIAEQG